MRRNRIGIFDPLWVGGSTALAIAMMANIGWSQVLPPVPAVPEAVQDATNAAQDAAKDAADTAKNVQKDATDTAQDAVKEAKDTAKDVQKDAKDTAQDVKETAKDAQKDARDTAQDAAKDAKAATRDSESAARETVKDAKNATRDAESTARDAVKDAKDTAKETVKDAANAARDVTRDVRDTVKDATDNARESIETRANARTERSVRTQANANNNFRAADLGIWFDRATRNGLTISDIAADTALAQVGFRAGDRIVSVGGRNITTEADFVRYLMNNNARGRMNVIVLRDGQQQTLYIDPTVISQQTTTTTTVDPLEQFGIILDDRYADRLLVWRVIPRSPAFYAGIRTGDVLTSFGNQRLANLKAFVQIVQRTRPGVVPIQVSRNGQMRVIEADFPDLQVSGTHTTLRQNLDTDVNVRTNVDTGVRANANVRGQINADQDLPPADAINAAPLPDRGGYYNDYRSNPPARGIFRRRR